MVFRHGSIRFANYLKDVLIGISVVDIIVNPLTEFVNRFSQQFMHKRLSCVVTAGKIQLYLINIIIDTSFEKKECGYRRQDPELLGGF